MKKTTILKSFICLSLSSLAFISCASTNTNFPNQDSYVEKEVPIEKKTDITSSNTMENYLPKDKSSLFSFGNKERIIVINEGKINTKGAFGGLKEQNANIIFDTKTQQAGIGSNYLLAYYFFSMSKEAHNKLNIAAEKYFSDFSQKKLDRQNKKSFKLYGTMPVRLDWGTVKNSTPNWGTGSAYLGYTFINNSPYFAITTYPVDNEYFKINNAADEQSLIVSYYLTKAELKNIIELTDLSNVYKYFNPEKDSDQAQKDEY